MYLSAPISRILPGPDIRLGANLQPQRSRQLLEQLARLLQIGGIELLANQSQTGPSRSCVSADSPDRKSITTRAQKRIIDEYDRLSWFRSRMHQSQYIECRRRFDVCEVSQVLSSVIVNLFLSRFNGPTASRTHTGGPGMNAVGVRNADRSNAT